MHDYAQGFADAIWTHEWMNAWERLLDDGVIDRDEMPWGMGANITAKDAPPHPKKFDRWALKEWAKIDHAHGYRMAAWFEHAQGDPYDAPKTKYDFGWQIGMQFLGTGVGVPENVREAGFKIHGHHEVMLEVAPKSGHTRVVFPAM